MRGPAGLISSAANAFSESSGTCAESSAGEVDLARQPRMHIVFVDNLLMVPPTGGAHTFLVDLCDSLVKLGHRVSVITQAGPEQGLTGALSETGAEVHTNVW